MLMINDYVKNPCRVSALPYWKEKTVNVAKNIKVVHDNDFKKDFLLEYVDEPYFRIIHLMRNIKRLKNNKYFIKTGSTKDILKFVQIINESYTDIKVTEEQIISYTKTEVYKNNLWIIVYEKETDKAVGCGIADYDRNTKEGILEWIQVLPQYRNIGIGSIIVNEILYRMKDIAKFCTVSGRVNNKTNPEGLYRKCGFVGNNIWHI